MPGLRVTATPVGYVFATAALAVPGLDITARATLRGTIAATELDMPGLAIAAAATGYTLTSAALAMPGLAVSADFLGVSLAMPGLALPKAIVSVAPGLGAVLALPGLAVPSAILANVAPVPLAAALAMPGLGVAAAIAAPGPTFLLAPVYGRDWAKLQNLVSPSVVQVGSPISNGVRMSGGPGGVELVGNVALASKNKAGPGWSAAFTLKKTDAFVPPSGGGAAFLILYFGAVGDGTGTAPVGGTLPANTVYVSPTGSDAAAGTLAAPFATLAHALVGRVAGDTIALRGGTHRSTATLAVSVNGAAGNPITIRNFPGEAPVHTPCLAAYETAGNSAWTLHDAATNTYKTSATVASGTYSAILRYNGVSYALNRYANLAWLMSTNYVYSSGPTNYYRGPGFFYNSADSLLYIRLESLTGARAVDLDQGNSAIPAGFDFNVPNNPDPRLYALNISSVQDVINFSGSNIVWDGIEIRGGDRGCTGAGTFITVQNTTVVDSRVTCNVSGGAHDWLFLQCPRIDSGFFSPWASWLEIKTSGEAADQKRSLCTESGTNFNLEFRQCRLGRYFDVFTASGHHLYLNNCDCEYVLDDGMQQDTDAYDVQFCRNYWRGPIMTDNGAVPQTVQLNSKYIIGNIIDNTRDLPGYLPEFYGRSSHPNLPGHVTWRHSHSTVVSHSDQNNTGVNPKKYAQNTFIYSINDNGHGCGIQREQRGAGIQESYNNIIQPRDKTKAIDGGDTRDGGEFRNGNVYWRKGAPTLEPLFTQLKSTSVPGGASYQDLVAWKASPAFTESGWESLSIEADPLLVDLPNRDFRLQTGSPAASGFVDLSAKGWPFLEPGTHAGAVAPGASDPLGTCGATFFRTSVVTGFPADIAAWPPGTEPDTTTIAAHITGARLTFFFQSNGFPGESPVPSLAVFNADGTVTTIPPDVAQAALPQLRNFPYAYTLGLSAASPPVLTLTYFDASTSTNRTITWTSALLASRASPSQGSFVWLCTPGRVVEITGEGITLPVAPTASATLAVPGLAVPTATVTNASVGTGWSNGYANRRRLVLAPQPDLAAETIVDHVAWIDTASVPGDWSWLAPAASVDPGASSANRPYGAAAPWNVPAQALPRHPDEANLCGLLWNGATGGSVGVGNFNLENTTFSFPVFYAAAGSDPNATLPLANDTYTVVSADTTANLHNQTMPWNAAWAIPSGSDGQAIVLDPTTGKEWNLWQVVVHTATKIINVGNGSLVPGDYRTRTAGWAPSRGSGIPYLAMLVRPFEVAQGRVDHALPMGIINVSKAGGFVGPATKTDGPTFGVDPGIPEGTRFYLSFTDAEREAWVATKASGARTAARVLANALREYGWFVTDHAGGAQIQLEDRITAGAAWDALGLVDTTATQDMLDGLVTLARLRAAAPSPYGAWAGDLLSWAEGRPLDLRLEDGAGNKLDHQLARYGGPGVAWLAPRLASVASDVGTSGLVAFSGKAGLGASEENVTGVWRAALMVIDPTTGADLTGKGRTLTRTGTFLPNTLLDGRPAAQVADQTGGFLRRTNPDLVPLFDTLQAMTEALWLVVGTASHGNGARLGGSPGDAFPNARFSWWVEHLGTTSGTAADVLQAGANWWDGTNYHNESTESVAGIADGSTLRHLMIVYRSGQHTQLYDGETNLSTTNYVGTPTAAGTIHPQGPDNESMGAGTGFQSTSAALTMGLRVLWPKAMSATERAMVDRPQRDGARAWGVGVADVATDPASGTTSPVAVPVARTIIGQTDLDVAALAYDDQLPRSVALVSATGDAKCAAAPAGGLLRLTPAAGLVSQPSLVSYVVGKGAKRSTSRLYLTVSSGVVIVSGAEGLAPDFPTSATIKGPVAIGNLQATYDALTTPEIAGGVTILVTPGGSLSGGLNFSTDGASASKPIVIRPGTLNVGRIVDPASFPGLTISGQAQINGNYNWVRGISAVGGAYIHAGVTGGRFNRCLFSGANAFCVDDAVSSTWDWCEFTGQAGVFLNAHPGSGNRNLWVYRSFFHNPGDPPVGSLSFVMLILGDGPRDQWSRIDASPIPANPVIQDCLFKDNGPPGGGPNGYSNIAEFKCFNPKLLRCSTVTTSSQRPPRFVYRHAENGIMQACYASHGGWSMRGRNNVIADSFLANGNNMGPSGGNVSYTTWKAYSLQHVTDVGNYPTPTNNYANQEDGVLAGISSPMLIGYDPSAGDVVIPTGSIVENDCSGTISKDKPSIIYSTRARSIPAYRETPGGPVKTWRIWTGNSDVGPNGSYSAAQ